MMRALDKNYKCLRRNDKVLIHGRYWLPKWMQVAAIHRINTWNNISVVLYKNNRRTDVVIQLVGSDVEKLPRDKKKMEARLFLHKLENVIEQPIL